MMESAEMLSVALDAELDGRLDIAALIRQRCFEMHGRDWCRYCKSEIDPQWCWCGSDVDKHGIWDGHAPVPMGCRCGFDREDHEADRVAMEDFARVDTTGGAL